MSKGHKVRDKGHKLGAKGTKVRRIGHKVWIKGHNTMVDRLTLCFVFYMRVKKLQIEGGHEGKAGWALPTLKGLIISSGRSSHKLSE